MQHPDEGTIHAWLDGALSADEAARVEAHVRECAQCQAAVAEARGFIAASSRILTALDNAPRGVIPTAAPARRVQSWVWRVAATVLVVATGTVLLVRERTTERDGELTARVPVGEKQSTKLDKVAAADSISSAAAPTAHASTAPTSTALASPATGQTGPNAVTAPATPQAFSIASKNAPVRRTRGENLNASHAEDAARLDEQREVAGARTPVQVSAPVSAPAPAMAAAAGRVSGVVASETPRQVGMKRTIGKTETFYELAPGDTVVLEEHPQVQLESIVVTGAATTRTAQPLLRSGKAAAVAEPQKTESAPPAAPPAAAPPVMDMQDAQHPEIHRISWLDPANGRVVILSGRHSQDELQEIRKKIQQLRDAAAQAKKQPE